MSGGRRRVGEFSTLRARGARAHTHSWKASPPPDRRSDRVVLEANPDYWDPTRRPQLHRIVFDHTLEQRDAVELVKTSEGRVDLVAELSPLETLRVAQSAFATVVKTRGSLVSVFGMFNMRKTDSPWRDIRLRQAANLAINREDLIRYATKGNGVVIPALLPAQALGYDADLAPYAFAPGQARALLREAGYADGLALTLIAPEALEVQATVVSKMMEQGGFQVDLQVLDPVTYVRQTALSYLEHPPEQHTWDMALATSNPDTANFPLYMVYHNFALDGTFDWVLEQPELRQLYEQVLGTVDRDRQQALMRQMERHTHAQAYFLFLYNPYNPIKLYAVNKAVAFVPYVSTALTLDETGVTDQHWSVRQGAMKE
jgi:peptide/nickel transport system substrate-binding protein